LTGPAAYLGASSCARLYLGHPSELTFPGGFGHLSYSAGDREPLGIEDVTPTMETTNAVGLPLSEL